MSKKFSINEGMLNKLSQNVKKANEIEAKSNFNVQYIDIKNIKRNEKNFYEIVNVDELAEDIKINGLNHNLVVRKLDDEQYELISGERRYTALSKLVAEGNEIFALVPCKVIEANDIDSEIILIQANAQTRELSDLEKLEQVKRLSELYKMKKKNGEKVPGKIREIIANDLKLSPTQVGRYERINNKLIPELKEILEKGDLTINNASEFSTLSEENQKVILEIINNKVEISKEEATQLKNKLKNIEQEKANELKRLESEKIDEIRKIEQEKAEALRSKQLISDEVLRLKNELNKKENKSDEEIKQIEGQLRVELKKELDNKYSCMIEEVKNEAKANKEEKERYKKELEELKAKAKENTSHSEEFNENYKLMLDIKNAHNALTILLRQKMKMEENKIKISSDIVKELENLKLASSVIDGLKHSINR
ncbi:ParB N-terminal domain-containing protein [Clostridium sp. Sa3CUN1]|uniref:ParB N-terminal domain-containing protein n=1 Tax=Clostridium gallinarum TaxID=2762246 RepID=A0ABR8Q5X8_9CLOT|nr:ParB/RepB/Spo0J family partition protein [Clostridium gallinarum]MBD7915843.1 ParB N-terminal domain-containing protein [Clostridium gallinarum]